jgi:hypothetical protein
MTKTIRLILISALVLLNLASSYKLMGQTELQVDEVQVIKDFEARLKDFRKVRLEPILPTFDISQRKYDYQISSKPIKLEYEKPSIRPLALPEIASRDIKNGGLEFGYGIPNAFMGGFHYGWTKDDFSSVVSVQHHSANNKNITNQKYLRNAVDVLVSNTLPSDLFYDVRINANLDYFNLYGTVANADTTNLLDSPQRRLMNGDVKALVRKTEIANNLDGSLSVRYNFIHNNIETIAENDIAVEGELDYLMGENVKLSFPAGAGFTFNGQTGQHALFHINPKLRYSRPFFNFDLGGDFAYHKNWAVFPDINFSLNKIFGYFDIYGGLAQNALINNSYHKILENPFFRMGSDSILMTSEKGYFAGVRGDIEGAKFDAFASYRYIDNAHLFVPSANDRRQFEMVYDSITDFSVEGSLTYEITRNITLSGSLAKHFYSTRINEKAWHRPDLEADFTARFSFLKNKLLVDGSLFFASGLFYPSPDDGSSQKLPVIFDISGKAEYQLMKNFQVFVQWGNITAKQYNRWYQYPSYRIHLIGGFKWSF